MNNKDNKEKKKKVAIKKKVEESNKLKTYFEDSTANAIRFYGSKP